jgi:hypothetical protein
MIQNPRIARVTWVDSNSTTDGSVWGSIATAIDVGLGGVAKHCVSVGFVVHDAGAAIVLVPHLASFPPEEDDQCAGDMTIPKCAIVDLTYLD